MYFLILMYKKATEGCSLLWCVLVCCGASFRHTRGDALRVEMGDKKSMLILKFAKIKKKCNMQVFSKF